MQCNRCGTLLPPGAPNCPRCGIPTPYNTLPPATAYGQPPYVQPPQPALYGQPAMGPVMVPQQQRRSGGSTGLIVVLVILLMCVCLGTLVGGGVLITRHNADATVTSMNDDATSTAQNATYTTMLTPTPYPPYTESNPPSGATFYEAAQQVIPSAQLASTVDNQHRPTELQSTFRGGQTIYLVYKWAQGNTGYVQTRWYFNGEMKHTLISKLVSQYATGYGYMSTGFYSYGNTGQGAVEVFWCQDAGCNHGGLAWVRPFSVTAS
ncbi:MAG: hypothetical protein ABI456_06085 [Ktedonobacteraceae bacterium]